MGERSLFATPYGKFIRDRAKTRDGKRQSLLMILAGSALARTGFRLGILCSAPELASKMTRLNGDRRPFPFVSLHRNEPERSLVLETPDLPFAREIEGVDRLRGLFCLIADRPARRRQDRRLRRLAAGLQKAFSCPPRRHAHRLHPGAGVGAALRPRVRRRGVQRPRPRRVFR
jgi:hypothetical protein